MVSCIHNTVLYGLLIVFSLILGCDNASSTSPKVEDGLLDNNEYRSFHVVLDTHAHMGDSLTISLHTMTKDTLLSWIVTEGGGSSYTIDSLNGGDTVMLYAQLIRTGTLIADLTDTLVQGVDTGYVNGIPSLMIKADTVVIVGDRFLPTVTVRDDDPAYQIEIQYEENLPFVPISGGAHRYSAVGMKLVVARVIDCCHTTYDTLVVSVIPVPNAVGPSTPQPVSPSMRIRGTAIGDVESIGSIEMVVTSARGDSIAQNSILTLPGFYAEMKMPFFDTLYTLEVNVYDSASHASGYWKGTFRGTDSLVTIEELHLQNGLPSVELQGSTEVSVFDLVQITALVKDTVGSNGPLSYYWKGVDGMYVLGAAVHTVTTGALEGDISVQCKVVDADGNSTEATHALTVFIDAPLVSMIGNDTTISDGALFAFNYEVTNRFGTIEKVEWDYNILDDLTDYELGFGPQKEMLTADTITAVVRVIDDDTLYGFDSITVTYAAVEHDSIGVDTVWFNWTRALGAHFKAYEFYGSTQKKDLFLGEPLKVESNVKHTSGFIPGLIHNTLYYYGMKVIRFDDSIPAVSQIHEFKTIHQGFEDTHFPYSILRDYRDTVSKKWFITDSVRLSDQDSVMFQGKNQMLGGGTVGAWPYKGYPDTTYSHGPKIHNDASGHCTEGTYCLYAIFKETSKEPGSVFFYYPNPFDSTQALRRDLRSWSKQSLKFDIKTTHHIEVKVSSRDSDLVEDLNGTPGDVVADVLDYVVSEKDGWKSISIPLTLFKDVDFGNIKVPFYMQYRDTATVFVDNIRYEKQ
ncbi:MAG: hypothetical protein OCC49_12285 [Fibrobacterales bacterium]